MLSNLTGWHSLIILAVILLLFGAPKLPGLARSLGQSMKILKSEIKPDAAATTDAAASAPEDAAPAPAPAAATAPAAAAPAAAAPVIVTRP